MNILLILSDHRLPDGLGIDFCLDVQVRFPRIRLGVVSGCLTPNDERVLKNAGIPYFFKPLLYRGVIDTVRRFYMQRNSAVVFASPSAPTTAFGGRGRLVLPNPPATASGKRG